jgi:hypothetical protein
MLAEDLLVILSAEKVQPDCCPGDRSLTAAAALSRGASLGLDAEALVAEEVHVAKAERAVNTEPLLSDQLVSVEIGEVLAAVFEAAEIDDEHVLSTESA